MSYVSDFDADTFVSSIFGSADILSKAPDETADQAIGYPNKCINLANELKAYKPVADGTEPSTWWVSEDTFKVADELAAQLKEQLGVWMIYNYP